MINKEKLFVSANCGATAPTKINPVKVPAISSISLKMSFNDHQQTQSYKSIDGAL